MILAACGDDTAGTDAGTDAQVDSAVDVGQDAALLPCRSECVATDPWRCDRCLPTVSQEITAVIWNGQIAVLGGIERGGRVVGNLRLYDPLTDRWSEGPPLPSPRHHVMVVALDGDLYALGGMEDLSFEVMSTAHVLRAEADDWQEIAPLPRARGAGFAAAIDNVIVVAAGQGEGRSDDERLQDAAPVFLYDPSANTWSQGAPIPTVREHCAGVTHDGSVWIFGGRRFSLEPTFDTVERYDVAADAWSAGPSMPSPQGGFAASLLDGVAYVSGGEERAQASRNVMALDLVAGTWAILDELPTARHGHAMAAIHGRVYVIGGADMPIFAAVDIVESFAPF